VGKLHFGQAGEERGSMVKDTSSAVLAGDVGGTKTNLAIFDLSSFPGPPIAEATFRSRDYHGVDDILGEFLSRLDFKVERAALGVAGPVLDGRTKVTNLPWIVDERDLMERLGLKSLKLLNDLVAFANAVPVLGPKDLLVLNEGSPDPKGTRAVIAPGTGLGQAFLTWCPEGCRAYPSEGGHADFAPRGKLQVRLLEYLGKSREHVSYEHVASGNGLLEIYRFLKESGYSEPPWLRDEIVAVEDPVPLILKHAAGDGPACPICEKTLSVFLSVLGAAAGNVALHFMATGGVYLGGGIPPRITGALQGADFRKAFGSKGRFSGLVEDIPLYVIMNPRSALLGAARYISLAGLL